MVHKVLFTNQVKRKQTNHVLYQTSICFADFRRSLLKIFHLQVHNWNKVFLNLKLYFQTINIQPQIHEMIYQKVSVTLLVIKDLMKKNHEIVDISNIT